jgi:hypothetical protein
MAKRKRSNPSKWNYKGNPTRGQWQFKAPSERKEESKILDENGIEIDKAKLNLEAIDLDQTVRTDTTSPTVGSKEDLGYITQFNFDSQFKRQQKAKSFVDRGLSFVREDPYGGGNRYEFESKRAYDGYWKVERDNNDIQENVILEVSSPYTYKNKFFLSLDLVKFNPYETIKLRVKAKRYYDFPEKALVAGGWFLPPLPYLPSFNLDPLFFPYSSNPSITSSYPRNYPPRGTLAGDWFGKRMTATILSEGDDPYSQSRDHMPYFISPGEAMRLRWTDGQPLYWNINLPSDYPYFPYALNLASYPDFSNPPLSRQVSTIDIKTDFYNGLGSLPNTVRAYGFNDYYRGARGSTRKATLLSGVYSDPPNPVTFPLDPSVREYDVMDVDISPVGEFPVRTIIFTGNNSPTGNPTNLSSLVYFEAEVIIENEKPVVVVKLISPNSIFLYTEDDSPGFREMPVYLL